MSQADRRIALVSAAISVISRSGVAAATTRAIVAEADMPLASFHYAFRSRNELMREVIMRVTDYESGAARETIRPGRDIRSAVRDGLQGYFEFVKSDPGHEQVVFELMQFALRTPGLEELATEQYSTYHAVARELLETGAAASSVRWSIDVADVARLLVTFSDGVTLAWLADRDDEAAGRVLDLAADTLAALTTPLPTGTPVRSSRSVS